MENRGQITEHNIIIFYLLDLAFIFREPRFRIVYGVKLDLFYCEED